MMTMAACVRCCEPMQLRAELQTALTHVHKVGIMLLLWTFTTQQARAGSIYQLVLGKYDFV
jgi:hypothetical protein